MEAKVISHEDELDLSIESQQNIVICHLYVQALACTLVAAEYRSMTSKIQDNCTCATVISNL